MRYPRWVKAQTETLRLIRPEIRCEALNDLVRGLIIVTVSKL
jgi:hypothetical protein